MDQSAKLQHQRRVEDYLQQHNVYEIFEYLLKELIVDQPNDVLTYLATKLELPPKRRYLLVGATGSRSRAVGKDLAARFRVEFVAIGDVLKAEVEKQTILGKEIAVALKSGASISDEVVVEILMPILEAIEAEGKGFVLEGYPLTRVQGLALLRAGIVPDSLVILSHRSDEFIAAFIDKYVMNNSEGLTNEDRLALKLSPSIRQLAKDALLDYDHNILGIKAVFPAQWHDVDGSGTIDKITLRTEKIFRAKARSYAPRKPLGVIILGPPGSGRSTQSHKIAQRYGLVQVSTLQLMKDQVQRGTAVGQRLAGFIQQRTTIPDDIIAQLVGGRLIEPDCKANGWVLDGSPKNIEQALALKESGVIPSHVFFLNAPDTLVYDRVAQRRLDPVTGQFYGGFKQPQTEEISSRLLCLPEDAHDIVKKRLAIYKENTARLHALYEGVAMDLRSDSEIHLLTEMIGDVLENSVPQDVI